MIQLQSVYTSKSILVQLNQNTTHVVTPQLLLSRILSQKIIQHLLQHLLRALPAHPLLTDQSNQVLTALLVTLPYAITTYQYEVIVFAQLHCFNVGMASNGLSVVLQTFIFLVVEITKTA